MNALVRTCLCSVLLIAACKGEEAKPAEKTDPTSTSSTAKQARPAPRLPDPSAPGADDGRPRPQLGDGSDDGEPRDWADPAQREEMRAQREERRKQRDAQLDTNHDGVLSPEEKAQRVAPMAKRLDSNADGKLTVDELAASSGRRAFDDPAAVDTNKDGEISLIELEAAVTARREQIRQQWRGHGRGALGQGGE